MKLALALFLSLTSLIGSTSSLAGTSTRQSLAFFVGHSEWNKGSQGIGLPPEWDYCKAVGEILTQLAPRYGMEVKIFYRGRGGYSHAVDRMHIAKNMWSPEAPILSCHYNETPLSLHDVQKNAQQLAVLFNNGDLAKKGSLLGTLILYKPDLPSQQIATCLLKNVTVMMKRPATSQYINVSGIIPIDPADRGSGEILASSTKSSVVLLEIGYGDNQIDSTLMSSAEFKTNLAVAILQTYKNNCKE